MLVSDDTHTHTHMHTHRRMQRPRGVRTGRRWPFCCRRAGWTRRTTPSRPQAAARRQGPIPDTHPYTCSLSPCLSVCLRGKVQLFDDTTAENREKFICRASPHQGLLISVSTASLGPSMYPDVDVCASARLSGIRGTVPGLPRPITARHRPHGTCIPNGRRRGHPHVQRYFTSITGQHSSTSHVCLPFV